MLSLLDAGVASSQPALCFAQPAGVRHWQARELRNAALVLARWLHAQHRVQASDRVAWLGHNHPHQLVLLLALAQLGAVLVPLNFRLAAAEWDAVLQDCGASLLVHDAAWDAAAPASNDASSVLAVLSGHPGLAALREELDITSPKDGCSPTGQCGCWR